MLSENSIFKSGGRAYKDYSRKVKAPPKNEMSILPIKIDTPKKKSLFEKMKDYDYSKLKKIALGTVGIASAIALLILNNKYQRNRVREYNAERRRWMQARLPFREVDLPEEDEVQVYPPQDIDAVEEDLLAFERRLLEDFPDLVNINNPPNIIPLSSIYTRGFGEGVGGNVFSNLYSKVKNMDSSTKKKLAGVAGLAGFIASALLNKNHKAPHGVPLFEGFGNKNPKGYKTYEKKKIPVIDEDEATDKEVATTWDKVKTLGEQTLLQLAIAGIGLASTIATVILQKKIYEALGIPVEDISLEPIKLDMPKFGDGGQQYKDYSLRSNKPNKTLPNPILPPSINTPKKKSLYEKMKDYDYSTLKKIALGVGMVASIALLILGTKYGINSKKELKLENISGLPPTNTLISVIRQDPLLKTFKTISNPKKYLDGLHEPALSATSYFGPPRYSGLGF